MLRFGGISGNYLQIVTLFSYERGIGHFSPYFGVEMIDARCR